ncbi:coat protein [Cassia yellow blotch virus]|uniref:Coat protein n=1 Tax=Cassia yellow blotch virus TaxID=300879 RepID=Q50L53_9BROM|nr:coat protein [Cassia yellow blotch virus]BAD98319.1 coat protein [Cassia yellow blotch virus]
MSQTGTGKSTRAQRRKIAREARKALKLSNPRPVVLEPVSSGIGRPLRARQGCVISAWSSSNSACDAKTTSQISITLPTELSSERGKLLKVNRVMLWMGLLPSVSGTVKSCVTPTQSTPAAAFQSALAVADSSKDVGVAFYAEAFKGLTLEQLTNDLSIYLYSAEALSAGDVVVHLEVEHDEPVLNRFFTGLL